MVTDISLIGWVAAMDKQMVLIVLASLAIVILTGMVVVFNRKIETAIEPLGDL